MCKSRAFYKHWHHHHANKFGKYSAHPRHRGWKRGFSAQFNMPPANVRELDDKYELYLFAPGLDKDDFKISLADHVLSISVDEPEETESWKRQEYSQRGFVRRFELNDGIDTDAITAKYEQGVLILDLPKLEGFETKRSDIQIA